MVIKVGDYINNWESLILIEPQILIVGTEFSAGDTHTYTDKHNEYIYIYICIAYNWICNIH